MQKLRGIFVLLVLLSGTFSTNFAFAGDSSEITAYSTSNVILPFGSAVVVSTSSTTTTGSIKITKDTVPDDDTIFTFTSTTLADLNAEEDGVFTLQDNNDEEDGNLSMVTYENLLPGDFDVTETDNPNYNTTFLCTDEQNDPSNLVLAPDASLDCTFTNTIKNGSIKITKDTVPDDDTIFTFTSTTLADLNAEEDGVFTLQDNDNEEDGKPSMVEYTGLAPNKTYDISETTNGDYTTTISCTDEQNPASLFLDPNEAIECIFTNTVNSGSIDSKVTQMGLVVDYLTGLKDSTDDKTDKKLDKIIKKINKAMNSKYWDESGNELVSKKGKKVFDETKKAVKDLSKISKKSDIVYPEITSAVDMLVGISNQLATDANDDAQAFAGDKKADKEIKKSNKEMNKAQKELDKGKPDKAIDKFKKAWEHALKAMKEKKVKDPKPIKEDKPKKEKKSKSDKKHDD